ncbi:hypothetical protein LJC42_03720 [Eubacteriales bacterium OttesenSCG-928-K08]|nr:hypothetical protein [Eubacteriales bacterium OttesenSCG-928-K08]
MQDKQNRREAIRAYKEKDDIGGLYRYIDATHNWKSSVLCTPNLDGLKSKLEFSKRIKGCPEPAIQAYFEQYGADLLEIEVIETLKRQPDQDIPGFRKDIKELLELYKERNKDE